MSSPRFALALAPALLCAGCNAVLGLDPGTLVGRDAFSDHGLADVGDDSSVGETDLPDIATDDASIDSDTSRDSSSDSSLDAKRDSTGDTSTDTGASDSIASDSGVGDSMSPDSRVDSTTADSAIADSATVDSMSGDSSVSDTDADTSGGFCPPGYAYCIPTGGCESIECGECCRF